MKIIAMLPTYNEAENISSLIDDLLTVRHDMEVLVVDDNSPDGTWRIVQDKIRQHPGRVHLVHRKDEKGRGSAGVAGFRKAVELKADLVIEMDADYSHHPRFVARLVDAAADADVVVGSRLVKGGGEAGRALARRCITVCANLYIRLMLGLPVRDATSGFRVFRRKVLETIGLERMESNGPAIVQEVLLACHRKGFRIVEVPILFEERRAGSSTFTARIMIAGILSVVKLRCRKF